MYLNKLFKLLVLLIGLTFSFTACDDHYDELKGDINDIYGQIDELKTDIEALKGQETSPPKLKLGTVSPWRTGTTPMCSATTK